MTSKERELLFDIHSKCMEETGVDEEAFGRVLMGNGAKEHRFKDHAFCFSKKLGFMNDDGDILIDETKKILYHHLDKDRAELIISKCLIIKGTPQDTAFDLSKCMFEVKFESK